MDHANIMNNCDIKAERIGLENLSSIERTIVLVSRINFEVELGGLDSFYFNSAGNEAIPTVASLEEVGATQAARALLSANALFSSGIPPRNRKVRFAQLKAIRKLANRPLDALNEEFSRGDIDVFARLCSYIESHSTELPEHGGAD